MTDFLAPKYTPADFRKTIVSEIFKIVERGENLQLISIPGTGASFLLRRLVAQEKIKARYLGTKADNYRFVYLDMNLVLEKTTEGLLTFFLTHLQDRLSDSLSLTLMVAELSKAIDKHLENENSKLVLIIDSTDQLKLGSLEHFFQVLRSFRDKKRDRLSLIFSSETGVTDNGQLNKFGAIAPLLTDNLLYLPPLNKKEAFWFLGQMEMSYDKKLSKTQKERIWIQTNGFTRTIKLLTKEVLFGRSLDELIKNPVESSYLSYHFGQVLASLSAEKEILRHILLNEVEEKDQKNMTKLKNLYLIDKNNRPMFPLFFKFLSAKFLAKQETEKLPGVEIKLRSRLTVYEYRALEKLYKNVNSVCSRQELVEAIWQDKNDFEIYDHAIDQLFYRLRQKLKTATPKVVLKTVRGRGYCLVSE